MAGKQEAARKPSTVKVFVGRQREAATISAAFEDVRAGHPRYVLLSGDPGIGKTRLAIEASELLRGEGAMVLWGRCHEEPGTPPYWPWIQVIRSYAGLVGDDELQKDLGTGLPDIASLVPALRDRFPTAATTRPLSDPEYARFRLFDSISDFVRNASVHRPVVLVFDNLHWADRPSLLLLTFLAENIGAARVLVVGTYRPDALTRSHPLSSTLADLTREASPVRIRLHGLGRDDIERFIEFATGAPPATGLAEAVHAHTEGNPLFVAEVVNWLRERGEIRPDDRGFIDLGIPEGVREVIGKHLGVLSTECFDGLAVASVVGREFTFELLRELPSIDQGILEKCLETALETRVIEETRPARYQFAHALIRETLYEELSSLRKARLHGEVGRALERMRISSDRDTSLSQIAHHFARAAAYGANDLDPGIAVDYCEMAAKEAVGLLAYEEGVRQYEAALELFRVGRVGRVEDRIKILVALGDARHRSGLAPQAVEAYREASRLARGSGDRTGFATAALGCADVSSRAGFHDADAARLLEEAIDFLRDGDDVALRSRLLSALARTLVYSGQAEKAVGVIEEALRLARRTDDRSAVCAALMNDFIVRFQLDLLEGREEGARELVAVAGAAGDVDALLEGTFDLVVECIEAGKLTAAEEPIAAHARLVAETGLPYHASAHFTLDVSRAIWEGRLADAEDLAKQGLATSTKMRGHPSVGMYGIQMFTVRREQGALAGLEAVVAKVANEIPKGSMWRPGLAVIYCELGKLAEAQQEFEALAKDDFRAVSRDALWPACLAYLSEVCHFLNDRSRAVWLHENLARYEGRNIVVGGLTACLGPASRFLGLLDETLGKTPEAERHFRDTIAMAERMNARVWLAHAQFELAHALSLADGDRESETVHLLAAARVIASTCGMRALEARIDAELRPREAVPSKPIQISEPLSDREIEVLRLVADGRSNREIAEKLVISVYTAANHVRSILAKTGSANRTEAASFAFRQGLVDKAQ